jgi:2-phospho-L-lactate guanylyltransferase
VDEMSAIAADLTRPLVVVVPDRHGRGTNALMIEPPHVIEPAFGADSLRSHRERAALVGAAYREVDSPLSLDIDTPEDLLLAAADLIALR